MTKNTKTVAGGALALLALWWLWPSNGEEGTVTVSEPSMGLPGDLGGVEPVEPEQLEVPTDPSYDFSPGVIRGHVRDYMASLGVTLATDLADQVADLVRHGAQNPDDWMQYATDQQVAAIQTRIAIDSDAARWAAGVMQAGATAYSWSATDRAAALGYLVAVAPMAL